MMLAWVDLGSLKGLNYPSSIAKMKNMDGEERLETEGTLTSHSKGLSNLETTYSVGRGRF